MFEILVRSQFSAAHQIRGYGGKCEVLHGHNWIIEATAHNPDVGKDGMLMDFSELKKKLNRVLETLDHKFINELPEFKDINPTSENIARFVFKKLKALLEAENVSLKSISVWETDTSCATYFE